MDLVGTYPFSYSSREREFEILQRFNEGVLIAEPDGSAPPGSTAQLSRSRKMCPQKLQGRIRCNLRPAFALEMFVLPCDNCRKSYSFRHLFRRVSNFPESVHLMLMRVTFNHEKL